RKRLPRCKMRLKKRLLAFSRRLHARIRKTRYMHKMRCLLINRRSLLLALRLLWKTPIFPSNSRFPRLCAKCLRSEERFSRNAETDLVCRLLLEKKNYNTIKHKCITQKKKSESKKPSVNKKSTHLLPTHC